ncbi:hypothetical protein ACN28S_01405 [Cystobacter fuscus]
MARFAWLQILPRIIPLLRRLLLPNIHTTEESGTALAHLVHAPALEGTTGKYFEGMREIRSSEASYDVMRGGDLWRASALMVGITGDA